MMMLSDDLLEKCLADLIVVINQQGNEIQKLKSRLIALEKAFDLSRGY
jgi:hypothetical protein